MLVQWFVANALEIAFYAVHSAIVGAVIWFVMLRASPPGRNFKVDSETGALAPHAAGDRPYSFSRCVFFAGSMIALGFAAVSPLALPLPLGFPGFQFLFMLAGLGIWLFGSKLIAETIFATTGGGWLAAMIFYIVLSAIAYAGLAPIWHAMRLS